MMEKPTPPAPFSFILKETCFYFGWTDYYKISAIFPQSAASQKLKDMYERFCLDTLLLLLFPVFKFHPLMYSSISTGRHRVRADKRCVEGVFQAAAVRHSGQQTHPELSRETGGRTGRGRGG